MAAKIQKEKNLHPQIVDAIGVSLGLIGGNRQNRWLFKELLRIVDERSDLLKLKPGVSRGQALRKLDPPLPLTRKMERFFLESPPTMGYKEALRLAQVRGLGGDSLLSLEIHRSHLGMRPERNEFHQSLILFLVKHRKAINLSEVGPLIDYINELKYGTKPRSPDFSLKGRTPATLRRDMEVWHEQLRMQSLSVYVPPTFRGWKTSSIAEYNYADEATDIDWSITEILDSQELYEEGRFMRHCVSTYQFRCQNRSTSIWSVRQTAPPKPVKWRF